MPVARFRFLQLEEVGAQRVTEVIIFILDGSSCVWPDYDLFIWENGKKIAKPPRKTGQRVAV